MSNRIWRFPPPYDYWDFEIPPLRKTIYGRLHTGHISQAKQWYLHSSRYPFEIMARFSVLEFLAFFFHHPLFIVEFFAFFVVSVIHNRFSTSLTVEYRDSFLFFENSSRISILRADDFVNRHVK